MKKYILKIRSYYFRFINSYIFKKNKVQFGSFTIYGILFIKNKGQITIGQQFNANSGKRFNPIGGDIVLRLITDNKKSKITIGKNCGISNSTIFCADKIEIGDNVLIGGGCKIWDTDFHQTDNNFIKKTNNIKCSPIRIGNNSFIGGQCLILKGVSIGENCIVGAGSVVTKNIHDNEVWGGNPAKYIRTISTPTS